MPGIGEGSSAGQEKSRDATGKAMEWAREQFSAAGEFSAEQGEAFKKFMRRGCGACMSRSPAPVPFSDRVGMSYCLVKHG